MEHMCPSPPLQPFDRPPPFVCRRFGRRWLSLPAPTPRWRCCGRASAGARWIMVSLRGSVAQVRPPQMRPPQKRPTPSTHHPRPSTSGILGRGGSSSRASTSEPSAIGAPPPEPLANHHARQRLHLCRQRRDLRRAAPASSVEEAAPQRAADYPSAQSCLESSLVYAPLLDHRGIGQRPPA